jgi:hypothetical protein
MPGRASAQAFSESPPLRSAEEQLDCPFGSPNSLRDSRLILCHDLAERLTAAGNYLGAVQRLLEIGYRRGQPSPPELLEKASSQINSAGEIMHQLRSMLTAHRRRLPIPELKGAF